MASFVVVEDRLTVNGVLDSDAEKELRDQLQLLFDSGTGNVTIDLSGVGMITSVCIGALVVFWIDLCEADRRANLIASPEVKKVLDMTGLTAVLMDSAGVTPPGSD